MVAIYKTSKYVTWFRFLWILILFCLNMLGIIFFSLLSFLFPHPSLSPIYNRSQTPIYLCNISVTPPWCCDVLNIYIELHGNENTIFKSFSCLHSLVEYRHSHHNISTCYIYLGHIRISKARSLQQSSCDVH